MHVVSTAERETHVRGARPVRILLVDDSAADRHLIRIQLGKSHIFAHVEEAANGAAGIERARADAFDCVLLDYQLPDMSGTEVLRALRASSPHSSVAVIVLSGRGDERTAAESIKLGAQDYLVKGATTPASIERAIGNAIEKAELVHALQAERQALAEAHSDLEAKVKERTRDLLAANLRMEREIAQRVRTEEALRASEARYQDLYDNSPDMLVSVEPTRAEVVSCNATLANRLGHSKEVIIGSSVFDLYDPECVVQARAAFQSFVQTGRMPGTDLRLACADGSLLDISHSATANRVNGGAIDHVRLSWRDITARRRLADEARRHHAELAHVARLSTLGEMASGLAHELNQPLTAVANYCDLAVEMSRDGSPPGRIAPLLEKSSTQAQRAGDIIRRLRALVRKNTDEVTCSDLNVAIREAAAILESPARENRVRLSQDLADGLPSLLIDRIQIQQVVLNLLRNGIEAAVSGDVEPRNVTIQSTMGDQRTVIVKVSDTGPGMDSDLLSRVFNPFETTKVDGMGLGLSISRSIVEAHGGRLWACSVPGEGATFQFSLPAGDGGAI